MKKFAFPRQHDHALPSDLWNSLQNHIEPNTLPSGLSLDQILENWVTSAGYPVVTVTSEGNNIRITQVLKSYIE